MASNPLISKILHDWASPISALRLGLDWADSEPAEAIPHLKRSVDQMESWLQAYRIFCSNSPIALSHINAFASFHCEGWVNQANHASRVMLATLMKMLPACKPKQAHLSSLTPSGFALSIPMNSERRFFEPINEVDARSVLTHYVLENTKSVQESFDGKNYVATFIE